MSQMAIDPTVATLIPGPRGLPVVGSIPDFRRDQLGFVMQMMRDYGDVVRYRLGPVSFNQINHPDGVQRVLQEHNRNYVKGPYWDPVRNVGGDGLFASEGTHWLRQRRLIQPTFHRERVASFADVMVHQTEAMLVRWQAAALTGEPVDVDRDFKALTMRIIAETMFGTHLDADLGSVSDAVTWLLADVNFRFTVPIYPKLGFPTPRNRRARSKLRMIDAVIYRIIDERRRRGSDEQDLLAMLMDARDEETGEPMTDRQLRDEVVTMFIAGHETTAVLMSWLYHILTTEPKWEARLAAEVASVLQGRRPRADDVVGFPTVRMAIDETLRLYPPAWLTSRVVVEDDVIGGFLIRKGETVGISPYVIHRLPAYWPDAERFDPLRFRPEAAGDRPRFAYVPFGGGPHQCIGNGFALLEAQLIFATIVSRFRLQAVPGRPVEVETSVTLRPRHGLWMTVHPRQASVDQAREATAAS